MSDDPSSLGVSIENASYIENNIEVDNKIDNTIDKEEYTPKLFSANKDEEENISNDKLFDQSTLDEEEFEIPAFLRKQKF